MNSFFNMPQQQILKNYLDLIRQLDAFCGKIGERFTDKIACRAGCSGCCRHISLFPVEAFALASALKELPTKTSGHIRSKARVASPDGPCPLLGENLCLLYDARPVICRTHGMPLLLSGEAGTRGIDFCPLNFQGVDKLPGDAVIDLDRVNETLAAINALFVKEWEYEMKPLSGRLSIAEALLLEL